MLALLLGFLDLGIEAGDIAHAHRRHQLVALLHLGDAPVQRIGGLLHVGDDRRQQMRNAFVNRQFEHLRIDHDQPYMLRLRLVEHRQDHCIDADRLARTGRAGDQQVRRLGQVGDHRQAADILAEADSERTGHVVVGLAGDDFGQLDRLPLGIGQLQRHARFSRDGLDDADGNHGQRPRQVARQIDDLRALDANRRLDLVAGNDRPRHGGQDLDLHAEIGELALDQARGVFQRFGTDRLGRRRRRIEQMQGRQLPADDRLGEERRLLLALDAGFRLPGDRHLDRRRLDDDRLVELDAPLFLLDDDLALLRHLLADLAVAPGIDAAVEKAGQGFQRFADFFACPQPGHSRKDAPPRSHSGQEQQCRTGVAQLPRQEAAHFATDQSARTQRQIHPEGVETQGFQGRTGHQQEQKTAEGDEQRAPVASTLGVDLAKAPPDGHAEQHDPPPGGESENIEQEIRNPCTGPAGRVMQCLRNNGMGPAWILLAETPQGHAQKQRHRPHAQPAGLLQERADFVRQRAGRIAFQCSRSHSHEPRMTTTSFSIAI